MAFDLRKCKEPCQGNRAVDDLIEFNERRWMMTTTTQDDKPLVVITGSSGLIGGRLAEALSGDHRIVGLDNDPPEVGSTDLDWIECDMTDDQSVASALQRVHNEFGDCVASLIHLAAYYDFSGEPSPLYREVTVEGTRRLLREAKRLMTRGSHPLRVQQLIFSSSLLLMKPSEDGQPLTASSSVEAEWDYPQSKLAAEKVIEQERNGIPTVILRVAGVYDEDGHSLPIAQQISRIYEKQLESYFFPGDKTHGQSFIHLDDLAKCVQQAIQRRQELAPYEVLLIGEEDVMSYEELQDEIGKLIHDKEWPAIRIPKAAAKAGAWMKDKLAGSDEDGPFIKPWMIDLADQNYPVNIQRARRELDWEPRHTLRETLPEIIRRLEQDPRGWYEKNGLPVPEKVEDEQQQCSGKANS